jgi:hypothetical protein
MFPTIHNIMPGEDQLETEKEYSPFKAGLLMAFKII